MTISGASLSGRDLSGLSDMGAEATPCGSAGPPMPLCAFVDRSYGADYAGVGVTRCPTCGANYEVGSGFCPVDGSPLAATPNPNPGPARQVGGAAAESTW